jgi:cytochrome c oxidase subunit 2
MRIRHSLIALMSALVFVPTIASANPLYTTCVACHGAKGEGNKALNAPAIASQEAWYVARQLNNFKAGIRGSHPKDMYGMQMRPMAMTLPNEDAVKKVAEHIASLPAPAKEDMTGFGGDAAKGKTLYVTCTACHGAKGEGNKALNAPKIATLPSWYLVRQLQNFKAGVRGANPKDTYGAQMRPMSMTLANDQASKDVVAYIKSL